MDSYFVGRVVGGDLVRVGLIQRDGSRMPRFAYAADYLASDSAVPLSRSLPLRAEPYDHAELEPYFRGLLPEGGALTALAEALGADERDYLTILGSTGLDCIGDVLVEKTEDPAAPPSWNAGSYELLDAEALSSSLNGLQGLVASSSESRLSLAGTQGKTGLAHRPGSAMAEGWYRPLGGAGSTHILKVSDLDRISEFEAVCMVAARRLGIDTATTAVVSFGRPVVVSERFDREVSETGGTLHVRRLHQEDLAQAFGVTPPSKYAELEGGTYATIARLLLASSEAPIRDLGQLTRVVVFNYLIGNCDNHLKNLSIISARNALRLAPAYDLVCTTWFERFSREMGARIGHTRSIDEVEPNDFGLLAQDLGLGPRAVKRICRELAEGVVPALAGAGRVYDDVWEPLAYAAEDVCDDLAERRKVVAKFGGAG